MKIMTTRWVEDKTVIDDIDAVGLMKVTGLNTKDQLIALLRSIYPGVLELKPATLERIDDVLAELERKADEPAPTWNT